MVNPLARVIMERNLKTQPIISSRVVNDGNNLDKREREIISDLIKGEKEIIEGTKKNTVITLDEAVNRMKNNR